MCKKTINIMFLFIITIALISLNSCKQSNSEEIIRISVNKKDIKQDILYSDLVEDVKFIHLETVDTSLNANLWNISKVYFDDNLIFCLDKDVFQGIMIFDKTGKHLNTIKVGEGSGRELTLISDATIDKERKEIKISCSPYIVVYSYKGLFLRREKMEFISEHFEYTNDVSAFTSVNFGLIVKPNNAKEKTYLPSYSIHRQYMIQPFQPTDKGILFRHSLCDTIFLVKENSVLPHRIIDFGKDKITAQDLKIIINSDQRELPYPDKMHSIKYYSENNQFIHFSFQYKKKPLITLYDKITKKTLIFPANKTINDVSFEKYVPLIIGAKDDYFVSTVSLRNQTIDITKYANKYAKEFNNSFNSKNPSKGYYNPTILLIKFKH